MGWNRKEPPHPVHERVAVLNAVLLMCGPGGIEDTTSSYANFRFVIFALSVFSRNNHLVWSENLSKPQKRKLA
jgi:hypothetical protein